MAPPLVGQHPTGVPEEEPAPTDQADHLPAVEGSERSLDMDFSSFSDCSSSTSEEHSTLHDVPSIRSLEIFDEGAACEETLADQNDRLRFQRDFWKTQCRTLWERQETFEKKVKFYQEALVEAEVEAKKAKEAASVATKKAEEERALKEAAEKEVAELQARLLTHLRTAVADDRPPRAERSSLQRPNTHRHPQIRDMRSKNKITRLLGLCEECQSANGDVATSPQPILNGLGPPEGRGNCKDLAQCFKKRTMAQKNTNVHEENEGPPSRLIVDMASRSYRTSQEPRLP
uniref:Uncharacterized protein n=1 Tax=Bursaphelenchus xylophilus TaxID=6326 RepID=A0A1I7SNP2_BURXY